MTKYSQYTIVGAFVLLLSLVPSSLFAQSREKGSFWDQTGKWVKGSPYGGEMPIYTSHTKLLFGIGATGLQDTYLSETTHSGLSFSLLSQTDYPLHEKTDKWHVYQEVEVFGGLPKNPANHSAIYFFGGRFSIGASWRAFMYKGLSLDIAPLYTTMGQGNLKLSNTNNVTNIKTGFGLDAWTRLRYRIPVETFPIRIQYSLRLPVVYAMFSPGFGQSYYEYAAGGKDAEKVKFYPASFHNSFEIQQHFLIDIPIRHITLTLGAEHHYQGMHLNHLSYRRGSWQGVIGVSFDLFGLSGNRTINSPYLRNALD